MIINSIPVMPHSDGELKKHVMDRENLQGVSADQVAMIPICLMAAVLGGNCI